MWWRRANYRPSRGQSALEALVGIIFVLIGLFVVIPKFGGFGILWTIIAVGETVISAYRALRKKPVGPEMDMEEEKKTPHAGRKSSASGSTEERLRELQRLYDQRLITQEEYEAKRQEILKQL